MVVAKSNDSSDESLDMAEIIADDVNILCLFDSFVYTSAVRDNLGDIDVLVCEIKEKASTINNLVNKFNPEKLILYGDKEKILKVLQKDDYAKYEENTKVNFKAENFGLDSFYYGNYFTKLMFLFFIIYMQAQNLPCNEDAEKGVIGSIFLDEDAILKVTEMISSEDFYYPRHKTIFETIENLFFLSSGD